MKGPGLLNLGRYSVTEWMACSISEDRLWPSDEKDLLKISEIQSDHLIVNYFSGILEEK